MRPTGYVQVKTQNQNQRLKRHTTVNVQKLTVLAGQWLRTNHFMLYVQPIH